MAANNSLADALSGYASYLDNKAPVTARAYDRIVDRLVGAKAGETAPRQGETLLPFRLPDDGGRLVSSAELLARGPLVVSMNRGHWCSFCRYELEALQGILPKVVEHGGSIIAITPERQAFAKKLKSRSHLEFPILSDVDNGYALSLGLAVWYGEEIKPIFAGIGIDLPLYQGNSGWLVPIPATFVVAPNGRIAASFVDADFRRRAEPEEILAAISLLRR